jgi:cytochrome c oxidase assembly protein subunit 15
MSEQVTRLQRPVAIAAVVANAAIAVTGCVVRLTGSGLGCPTWPQCVPGSMTPVDHPELDQVHQWIEYGNRLLSGVVGLIVIACVVLALMARPRRRRAIALSLVLAAGVLVQALVGGVTVLTGLLWWTVSIHLLVSTVLVWIAVLLVDEAGERRAITRSSVPRLLVALTAVLAVQLAVGTLVTAAGPHAGAADVARLSLPVDTLAHTHGALVAVFLGLLFATGFALRERAVDPVARRRFSLLLIAVLVQGALGLASFWTGVPAVLVAIHVLGAMVVTTVTAALWCAARVLPRPAELRTP